VYQVDPDVLDIAKALGEDTRFAIFRQITSAEKPLTVKDLVALFGMHHSAIRIHLNKLEEAGLIISRKQHNPGAVGRPQLTFLPNPRALSITLPARNYQLLSQLLLEFAARSEDPDKAKEFAHSWGGSYIRTRGYLADGRLPFEQGVAALVEELQALGNAPQNLLLDDDSASFTQSNCPFLELAQRYRPLVCSLHQSLNRGMMMELTGKEIEWRHESRMAEGDPECAITFGVANGEALALDALAFVAAPPALEQPPFA
jgi:predicted ArsR family transcriptional regulator